MPRVTEKLGISDRDYEGLLEGSRHLCWICGASESVPNRRLALDHDHRTGQVRGLLCTSCNRRLGAQVDPEWLVRAARYLIAASREFDDSCPQCPGVQVAPGFLERTAPNEIVMRYRCAHCEHVWRCSWDVTRLGQTPGAPTPQRLLRDPTRVGTVGDDEMVRSLFMGLGVAEWLP